METVIQSTISSEATATAERRVCSRCIYDETVSRIQFDEDGVCNYCRTADELVQQYQTGKPEGERRLQQIIAEIKRAGRRKKYDCVVGVSGGTDSSFMLAKAVEWGLRPLAVHYDNTWNTAVASENIRRMTAALGVDLHTLVVDNREADDIFRAFFRSGVPELDCSTDIALAETLYRAAAAHGVKYILEGHSFVTEGVSPLGNNYFDGRYIDDVHKKFGTISMRTFPNMRFADFMKWILLKRIKKIRPLWYISYDKEAARKFLEERYGWEYYGGHHLENRLTAFLHTVYNPQKFGIDNRNWSLAAAARHGLMPRREALQQYGSPVQEDAELVAFFKKRLALSDDAYNAVMEGPKRSYTDFKTYKKRFEKLRPLFYVLAKLQLVPTSFYMKYTSKTEGA